MSLHLSLYVRELIFDAHASVALEKDAPHGRVVAAAAPHARTTRLPRNQKE